MNGSTNGKPEPSRDSEILESPAPDRAGQKMGIGSPDYKPLAGIEKFTLAMERFSGLSTEMITLLMGLSEEISKSAEELSAVRSAVDLKRKELESLQETEKLVLSLERQTQDLRRQKEDLERLITDQRSAWEAEKVRRARQEKEYDENRKIQREHEEEEYRKIWTAEQLKAKQALEEELHADRQERQDAQEAAEKDLLNRELILKKREVEWGDLIRELEQFLSKLARRTRPQAAAPTFTPMEESAARSGLPVPSTPAGDFHHEEADLSEAKPESQADDSAAESLMWENTWDDLEATLDVKRLLFGQDPTEDQKGYPSSSNELHILQTRKAEDSDSEPSAKRDTVPLRFSPKKSNNHKPEN